MPIGFGMNFVDVVATDQNGKQNSTTCFVLAGAFYSAEAAAMPGAVGLRLDPYAIGDPDPNGLNSLNDLFYTVLKSDALRQLVDQALVAANPINDGSCGVFACEPDVNYNQGTLGWGTPTTTLSLIPGGLRATVYLPNVHLNVRACGTTCCIGGSTSACRRASSARPSISACTLQGGLVRTALKGTPTVTVGTVSLNGSGFCGFIVDLLAELLHRHGARTPCRTRCRASSTARSRPLLDQVTSSLDISTLAQSFMVPRLDGTGSVNLGFGLGVHIARHHDRARTDRRRHAVHAGHDRAEPAEPRHRAAHARSAARSAGHEQRAAGRRVGVRGRAQRGAARRCGAAATSRRR